jgi:hypothetical protein
LASARRRSQTHAAEYAAPHLARLASHAGRERRTVEVVATAMQFDAAVIANGAAEIEFS